MNFGNGFNFNHRHRFPPEVSEHDVSRDVNKLRFLMAEKGINGVITQTGHAVHIGFHDEADSIAMSMNMCAIYGDPGPGEFRRVYTGPDAYNACNEYAQMAQDMADCLGIRARINVRDCETTVHCDSTREKLILSQALYLITEHDEHFEDALRTGADFERSTRAIGPEPIMALP